VVECDPESPTGRLEQYVDGGGAAQDTPSASRNRHRLGTGDFPQRQQAIARVLCRAAVGRRDVVPARSEGSGPSRRSRGSAAPSRFTLFAGRRSSRRSHHSQVAVGRFDESTGPCCERQRARRLDLYDYAESGTVRGCRGGKKQLCFFHVVVECRRPILLVACPQLASPRDSAFVDPAVAQSGQG
jgi:hypothetical protein